MSRVRLLRSASLALALTLALAAGRSLAQGIGDGGFEGAAAGFPPGAPWSVASGMAVVSSTADALFPTEGSRYLVIGPGATGPAAAGYGPHAPGTVGQVAQTFVRPPGPFLNVSFDWEWLPAQTLPSASFNDFFSVDLLNAGGALVANLLFIDTGQLTAANPLFACTNVPGICVSAFGTYQPPRFVPNQAVAFSSTGQPAPAGAKRAWFDLSSLTAAGQTYTLAFSVGNGGNASGPSHAYVDDVQLAMAARNASDASLRVLAASSRDGVLAGLNHTGDLRIEAPFTFRTKAGGPFSIRASSQNPGTGWALFYGAPLRIGNDFGAFGVSNIDLAQPFGTIVDGIGGMNPIDLFLGTIPPDGSAFLEGSIPAATAPGTRVLVQGLFLDPTGPSPFLHSAATEILVRPYAIPTGQAPVPGGAQSDDGTTLHTFGAFGGGSFAFYDQSHTQVTISSNGYLSFGFANDSSETEAEMASGPPRIAALWDDWDPSVPQGSVTFTETASTFTVTWSNVPEFGAAPGIGSDFAIQLYSNGTFTLYYGTTTLSDGLAGISPGGLSPSIALPVNLSATGTSYGLCGTLSQPPLFGSVPSYFERFGVGDACDAGAIGTVGPARITFANDPSSTVFYRVFSGTR